MGQDSTRLIGIPKWQVERLITDAILYRSCDTLQAYQFEVIKKAVWTIQTMDSLLTLRADEINNLEHQGKYYKALDSVSQEQIKEVGKDKKLFEFTTYAATGGTIGGSVAGPLGAGIGAGFGVIVWAVIKFLF